MQNSKNVTGAAMLPITIQWIACPYWQGSQDETVWLDVEKADRSWAMDSGYYITSGGGGAAIDGRYAKVGELITSGAPIWMVALCLDCDEISFTDGRHRFAWLRDHGVRALPVQVPPDQAASMKARFGTKRRVSRLTQKGAPDA